MIRDVPWLRSRLLKWFDKHGRAYPWRETSNPYHIMVAEIMLQRTRADQVKPVYETFISRFPNSQSLAAAEMAELENLLWPLGLHSRPQLISAMARDLLNLFGGNVPSTREEIKRISGVGDYVAGAVLSVAFNKPEWIVDANVVRVFSRFWGLQFKGEARRAKQMKALAKEYSQTAKPKMANLALLDHASLICKSGKPLCLNCPIKERCNYFQQSLLEN